jgi:hypothetical protein
MIVPLLPNRSSQLNDTLYFCQQYHNLLLCGLKREADHFPLPSAKVQNEWK